jgi:hypothetical protein
MPRNRVSTRDEWLQVGHLRASRRAKIASRTSPNPKPLALVPDLLPKDPGTIRYAAII